jgi:hypothetical protein
LSNRPGYDKAKKLIMVKTPNGKIARLPRNIRDELFSDLESNNSKTANPGPFETTANQA